MTVRRAQSILSLIALGMLSGCGSDSSPSSSVQENGSPRELIANGGFETPVVTDTVSSTYAFKAYNATTPIDGWVVANVDIVHRKLWQPASGKQSLDLNASSAGSIGRRVDTRKGEQYILSLSYATTSASASGSPTTRACRVVWNGVPVETLSVERSSEVQWTGALFALDAQGNDSLRIESITAGPAGVAIDDVSLLGK